MGYYSDVALALTKDMADEFRKVAAEYDREHGISDVVDFLKNADEHYVDEKSGAECYFWKNEKWYTEIVERQDFEGPFFVEEFINDSSSDEFYFVRIGEGDNDVETLGSFWGNPFNIYAVSKIHISHESINPFEALYKEIVSHNGEDYARKMLEQAVDALQENESPSLN